MGIGKSRPVPISYEDAVAKLSREELARLEASWGRWRSPGRETLNRRAFREAVLSATFVPDSVAEQLFAAVVPRGRDGLSYRDLIVAIVVLTKSTREERHKFLFHVFSEDGEVVVTAKMLEKLRVGGEAVPKALGSAIANVEKLTVEEFGPWVEKVRGDIPLAAWLLDSPPALSCHEPMPNFYQSLAGITHLEEPEILELDKLYWSLADPRLRKLHSERFAQLVSPPLPAPLVPGLFAAFDENHDGQIDLKELVCGLSASARGPSAERVKFVFKIFDRDRDGLLNRAEVEEMTEQLLDLSPRLSASPNVLAATILGSRTELSLQDFLLAPIPPPLLQTLLDLLHQIAHIVLGLTPQDKATEATIVKLAFEEIGKRRRKNRLRSWHQRSLNDGRLEEGQVWYLIASQWWNQWQRWTSMATPQHSPALHRGERVRGDSNVEYSGGEEGIKFVPPAPPSVSSEGSLPPTPPPIGRPQRSSAAVSEAGSSSGSNAPSSSPAPSSTASPHRRVSFGPKRSWSPCPRISLGYSDADTAVPVSARPPPIDNHPLLDTERHPWTKLSSLSSEGGLLKRDLMPGRDYIRVPEPLWNALVRWYGGGYNSPPLQRKVIISPAKQLELELYPVTVTILRHEARGVVNPANRIQSTGSAFTYAMSATAAAVQRGLAEAAKEWQVQGGAPRRLPLHRLCVSRTARVGEVCKLLQALPALRLTGDNFRLWLFPPDARDLDDPALDLFPLEDEDIPLQELGMKTGSRILLEVRNKDLTWPEELSRLAKSIGSGDANALRAPNTNPAPKGVTGLYNLGNTCYMNSAIQCVSNTHPLTLYFEQGIHRAELNRENALGMKGNIAVAYGELVRELWSAQSKFIAPLKLKVTIAKYARSFDDLNQHDCQELLAFLLDGLHEDLNRVTRKPYTELKDSNGRSDALVAAEAWDNHLKRNQSILVDLFHGLLRSQVTSVPPSLLLPLSLPPSCSPLEPVGLEVECGECGNVSTRFDPFTFLSLPLPLDECLLLSFVMVRLDGSRPTHYALRVPPDHSLAQLAKMVAAIAAVPDSRLLLLELAHTGAILRFLSPEELVKRLACTQGSCLLFAFEIPDKPPHSPSIPNGSVSTGAADLPQKKSSNPSNPPQAQHSRSESNVSVMSGRSEVVTECVPPLGPAVGYVVGLHRKMEQQDTYFLAHQRARPVVFGLPLILPAESEGRWSAEGLYDSVWTQVSRLVSPASKQTQGLPNNHALDGDRDPSAPEFPFRLVQTNREGTRCALCPWFKLCLGCQLPLKGPVELGEGVFVGVDWDLNALHLRYQHSQEMLWTVDDSVEAAAEAHRSPVTLQSALHSFTQEETLGSADPVYCSRCKTHGPAKKRLAIWKLPPILIVHLKRFQFVGNRWVKSTKMVSFPKEGFNPSSFMASMDSDENPPSMEPLAEVESEEEEMPASVSGVDERRRSGVAVVGEERSSADIDLLVHDPEKEESGSPVRKLISSVRRSGKGGDVTATNPGYEPGERTRTESTVSLAPMLEPNDHRLLPSADPLSLHYDLYAIACHYGVLGAGHYVCYAKHPNKEWYLYNDSKVKAVSEDEVDGNMAYLLFYQRRGLDAAAYLPKDLKETPLPNGAPSDPPSDSEDKHCTLM